MDGPAIAAVVAASLILFAFIVVMVWDLVRKSRQWFKKEPDIEKQVVKIHTIHVQEASVNPTQDDPANGGKK